MESMELLEVGRSAMWLLIRISAPIMLIALSVGLAVSLFQALTQIQEQTLTFVPKILAILFALLLFLPYIGNEILVFSEQLSSLIVGTNDPL
jgi:flagellar biosynthetic protein FliQ